MDHVPLDSLKTQLRRGDGPAMLYRGSQGVGNSELLQGIWRGHPSEFGPPLRSCGGGQLQTPRIVERSGGKRRK